MDYLWMEQERMLEGQISSFLAPAYNMLQAFYATPYPAWFAIGVLCLVGFTICKDHPKK